MLFFCTVLYMGKGLFIHWDLCLLIHLDLCNFDTKLFYYICSKTRCCGILIDIEEKVIKTVRNDKDGYK